MNWKRILYSLPVIYGTIVSIISSYGSIGITYLNVRGYAPPWLTMDVLAETNSTIVAVWGTVGVIIGKVMIAYGIIKNSGDR